MTASEPEARIVNAMTVDVEDYFQVSAFEKNISRSGWEMTPLRVGDNTSRLLDLFDEKGIKATFFVLGWVAERIPEVIKRMAAEGHEVASHGYEHTRVIHQQPHEFAADIKKTKAILEDLSGKPVRGYRAASFSITPDNFWALDLLADTGHEYSSSIYPVKHDLYGIPDAPRFAFRPRENGILEIPVTTNLFGGKTVPSGGGGYFRLMPYPLYRYLLRRVHRKDQCAGVFYFHPWEIDPAQPTQQNISLKTRFRHYTNLPVMEKKISQLLDDFSWSTMEQVFMSRNDYPVVPLSQ